MNRKPDCCTRHTTKYKITIAILILTLSSFSKAQNAQEKQSKNKTFPPMIKIELRPKKSTIFLPPIIGLSKSDLMTKVIHTTNRSPVIEIIESGYKNEVPTGIVNNFIYPTSLDSEIRKQGFTQADVKVILSCCTTKKEFSWGTFYSWAQPSTGSKTSYYFQPLNKTWALRLIVTGPLTFESSRLNEVSVSNSLP